jgi:predicted HNH restriction endonuclease
MNNDNRLENLRFLCPNCHSQTTTYGSRNQQRNESTYEITDELRELVELMIYYKMSYPTGQKDECTIQIKEGSNEIITPDSTYRLSDEVFLYVYLLSNRAIANIYKVIKDD